jgi:hypothetical protein
VETYLHSIQELGHLGDDILMVVFLYEERMFPRGKMNILFKKPILSLCGEKNPL